MVLLAAVCVELSLCLYIIFLHEMENNMLQGLYPTFNLQSVFGKGCFPFDSYPGYQLV
jgi:hypothetical protein